MTYNVSINSLFQGTGGFMAFKLKSHLLLPPPPPEAAGVTIFSFPTSFILLVFLDHRCYDSTTIKHFTFSSPHISLNKEA